MQAPFEVLSATPSTFLATTTNGAVLAANAKRRSAVFVNNGTVDVFMTRGATAAVNQGILLKGGGGSYEINSTNLYKGVVSCITASGTAQIAVEEGI